MSGNMWILTGLICLAFSAYAISHGFSKRQAEKTALKPVSQKKIFQAEKIEREVEVKKNVVIKEVKGDVIFVQERDIGVDLDYDVSPLSEKETGEFQRSVVIRNNSKLPAYDFHVTIKCNRFIRVLPMPEEPKGGELLAVNYRYLIENGSLFIAEVAEIPSRRYIKVVFESTSPFEIEKITIY